MSQSQPIPLGYLPGTPGGIRFGRIALGAALLWLLVLLPTLWRQTSTVVEPWAHAHFDHFAFWATEQVVLYLVWGTLAGGFILIAGTRGSASPGRIRAAVWILTGTFLALCLVRGLYTARFFLNLRANIRLNDEWIFSGATTALGFFLQAPLLLLAALCLRELASRHGPAWFRPLTAAALGTAALATLAMAITMSAWALASITTSPAVTQFLLLISNYLVYPDWIQFIAQLLYWPILAAWALRQRSLQRRAAADAIPAPAPAG